MLELTTLITLSVIAGIASYLQTLTGFAFSLILMSAIAATGVIGIGDGVMMTSFLTLANGSYILFIERRYVSGTTVRQIVPVALVAGTLLLPVLLSKSLLLLKFILGLIVILSSLSLIRPIHGAAARPPRFVFAMSGLAGGLMGGLFANPGPPIVYAVQRYLPSQRQVRATLVVVFATITITRIGFSGLVWVTTGEVVFTAAALFP